MTASTTTETGGTHSDYGHDYRTEHVTKVHEYIPFSSVAPVFSNDIFCKKIVINSIFGTRFEINYNVKREMEKVENRLFNRGTPYVPSSNMW